MSAKLMPETFPEKMGWVDRERLLDVSGRGRQRQLDLLKKYGWKYHEKPGGGCLLTDTSVALKIKDMQAHRKVVFEDVALFKIGRYMVLENGTRCVISRNEEEGRKLDIEHEFMDKIELQDIQGPMALVEKNAHKDDRILAARIVLGYAKTELDKSYNVRIGDEILTLMPYAKEDASKFLLLQS